VYPTTIFIWFNLITLFYPFATVCTFCAIKGFHGRLCIRSYKPIAKNAHPVRNTTIPENASIGITSAAKIIQPIKPTRPIIVLPSIQFLREQDNAIGWA
jgi:hypothetical protein